MEAVLNIYKTPIEENQPKLKMKKMIDLFKTLGETSQGFIKKD